MLILSKSHIPIPGSGIDTIQISYYILRPLPPTQVIDVLQQAFTDFDSHSLMAYAPRTSHTTFHSGTTILAYKVNDDDNVQYHTLINALQIFQENYRDIGYVCMQGAFIFRGPYYRVAGFSMTAQHGGDGNNDDDYFTTPIDVAATS